MVFKETLLGVADNSGAKLALCIKVLGKPIGYPGAILIVTLKHAVAKKFRSKKKNLKRGEIHKVLLGSVCKSLYRKSGYYLAGPCNYVIILRKDNIFLPFGNRIKRPLFNDIRRTSVRIATIAPNLF
jgi:large subunit ribosomal protein L14